MRRNLITEERKIAVKYGLAFLGTGVLWSMLAPVIWIVIIPITDGINHTASRAMFWSTSWMFWMPGALLMLYGIWLLFQNPVSKNKYQSS
jgi:hypothetical protein